MREAFESEARPICELPAAPIGRGATLNDAALDIEPGIPSGGCNVFDALLWEPDGSVKPCCGAGLTAAGLTMGNVRHESLPSIAERMQADPLLNSLRASRGPACSAGKRNARGIQKGDEEEPGNPGGEQLFFEGFQGHASRRFRSVHRPTVSWHRRTALF